jgi:hypothetical protein
MMVADNDLESLPQAKTPFSTGSFPFLTRSSSFWTRFFRSFHQVARTIYSSSSCGIRAKQGVCVRLLSHISE